MNTRNSVLRRYTCGKQTVRRRDVLEMFVREQLYVLLSRYATFMWMRYAEGTHFAMYNLDNKNVNENEEIAKNIKSEFKSQKQRARPEKKNRSGLFFMS